MKYKVKLAGVTKAAKAAGVKRLHIYLCFHGRRNPSPRVAEAIKKYVVAYVPIRTDAEQPRDKDTNVT